MTIFLKGKPGTVLVQWLVQYIIDIFSVIMIKLVSFIWPVKSQRYQKALTVSSKLSTFILYQQLSPSCLFLCILLMHFRSNVRDEVHT